MLNSYIALLKQVPRRWNHFWFSPSDPATLCLIRVLAGSMLVYTHVVWSLDLEGFLSDGGRLSVEFSRAYHESIFGWSHLHWFKTPATIWPLHIGAIGVLIAFTLGWQTRITGILSCLITISYANRAAGALYGLDQVNGFLSLYLAIGPAGAAYSIDRWLANRRAHRDRAGNGGAQRLEPLRSSGATLSIRLMQLHMCIMYFVAGCGKLRSDAWWNGDAIWWVFANYEYQSVDMLWLSRYPMVIDLLTHATVFFEVTYIVLVWPRVTRPVILTMAVTTHLVIGLCVGMMTFGLIMIVGNMAFLSPTLVRAMLSPRARPSPADAPVEPVQLNSARGDAAFAEPVANESAEDVPERHAP